MNAAQHVAWAKERAIAELDAGGPTAIRNAIASVQSDLRKHPDTADHAGIELLMLEAAGGFMRTDREVRHFIEGIH